MIWETIKKVLHRMAVDRTWANLKRNWHRPRTKQEDEIEQSPPQQSSKGFLPALRLRALTLSSGHIPANHISDQSRSLLLVKLPPEIRQKIWRQCIGYHDYDLRIFRSRWWRPEAESPPVRFGRVLQTSCPTGHEYCTSLQVAGAPCGYCWVSTMRPSAKLDVMSMLRSCRQV